MQNTEMNIGVEDEMEDENEEQSRRRKTKSEGKKKGRGFKEDNEKERQERYVGDAGKFESEDTENGPIQCNFLNVKFWII